MDDVFFCALTDDWPLLVILAFLALCPFIAPAKLLLEPVISGGLCVITDSLRLFLNL